MVNRVKTKQFPSFSWHVLLFNADLYTPLSSKIFWHTQGNSELGKHKGDDLLSGDFVAVVRQDHFI